MTFTRDITPKICLDKKSPDGTVALPAAYAGKVVMRALSYDERMDLVDIEIEPGDTEETVSTRLAARGSMKMIRSLAKRLPDFVVSVDLKRLEDGFVFTSLDELLSDSDMASTITELAMSLLSRYRVGNVASTI